MTAIYAYSLPVEGRAALVADNREIVTGRKVEKVFLSHGRFGVAVYGIELTVQAIGVLGSFEGRRGFDAPENANAFAEYLADTAKSVVRKVYPLYSRALADGLIPQASWEAMLQNKASFVVLDTHTLDLLDVDMGFVWPPERIASSVTISRLVPARLHLHASARRAANGANDEPLPEGALNEEFFSARITRDSARASEIGCLGAALYCNGAQTTLTPAFQSTEELIEQEMARTVGFKIVVSPA